MIDGYNSQARYHLSRWAFDLINGAGDLFDIKPAILKDTRPDFGSMGKEELMMYLNLNGHCSALVKVSDDLQDLMMGHASWFIYSSMLRIFKVYEFSFSNPRVRGKTVAFSSYPGLLSSLDDFYMMDSGLGMVRV